MKNKKILIIVTLLVIVAATAGSTWWFLRDSETQASLSNENSDVNIIDYGPAEENDVIEPSDKQDMLDGNANPTTATDSSIEITTAEQQERTVYIRAIITGMTGGTCEITLRNGNASLIKQAPITVQASYATCQGFNIPSDEFSAKGTWSIDITASGSNGTSANTASKVEVR